MSQPYASVVLHQGSTHAVNSSCRLERKKRLPAATDKPLILSLHSVMLTSPCRLPSTGLDRAPRVHGLAVRRPPALGDGLGDLAARHPAARPSEAGRRRDHVGECSDSGLLTRRPSPCAAGPCTNLLRKTIQSCACNDPAVHLGHTASAASSGRSVHLKDRLCSTSYQHPGANRGLPRLLRRQHWSCRTSSGTRRSPTPPGARS